MDAALNADNRGMKVLFHFNVSPSLRDWLTQHAPPQWDIVCCPETDQDKFDLHWPDADMAWHVLKPITAAMLQHSPRLRLIQKIGVGVNTIDLEAARARGIAVCNMPGVNSRAVAEMTLGLMLAAARRLTQISADLGRGQWAIAEPLQEKLFELHGKTVGLVGSGNVPRMLAPWLDAMGVRVVYYGRSQPAEFNYPRLTLEDLLAQSDMVSVHLPLTAETRGMFGKAMFARVKRGAVFINTARGELVDEAALGEALDSGRLSLACLDVFAFEPLAQGHPLLQRHDVIATPHMAWLTQDMFHRALHLAVENGQRLEARQPLRHRVV